MGFAGVKQLKTMKLASKAAWYDKLFSVDCPIYMPMEIKTSFEVLPGKYCKKTG